MSRNEIIFAMYSFELRTAPEIKYFWSYR